MVTVFWKGGKSGTTSNGAGGNVTSASDPDENDNWVTTSGGSTVIDSAVYDQLNDGTIDVVINYETSGASQNILIDQYTTHVNWKSLTINYHASLVRSIVIDGTSNAALTLKGLHVKKANTMFSLNNGEIKFTGVPEYTTDNSPAADLYIKIDSTNDETLDVDDITGIFASGTDRKQFTFRFNPPNNTTLVLQNGLYPNMIFDADPNNNTTDTATLSFESLADISKDNKFLEVSMLNLTVDNSITVSPRTYNFSDKNKHIKIRGTLALTCATFNMGLATFELIPVSSAIKFPVTGSPTYGVSNNFNATFADVIIGTPSNQSHLVTIEDNTVLSCEHLHIKAGGRLYGPIYGSDNSAEIHTTKAVTLDGDWNFSQKATGVYRTTGTQHRLNVSSGGTGLNTIPDLAILYGDNRGPLSTLTFPTSSPAGKVLAINSSGNGFEWSASAGGGTGTTYTTSVVESSGIKVRLTGSDSSTDDVKFAGSGATSVARTDASTITISSTDTNTTTTSDVLSALANNTLPLTKDIDGEFTALTLTNQSDAADATGKVSVLFNLEDSSGTVVDSAKILVEKKQTFTSTADTQDSRIKWYTSINGTITEGMSLTGTSLDVEGGLEVKGGSIDLTNGSYITSASAGTLLLNEDIVKTSGDLLVGGNNIKASDGTTAITLSGADVTIAGNLTVNGDTTTVNTATLSVEDPLIILASGNNGADTVDIGFYGLYDTSGSQDLYAGLFRDANDSGKFKLFKDLQAVPTTTVNVSGTGYAVGTLVANLEGAVTGNVTGNVSGNAGTVTLTSDNGNASHYVTFADAATGSEGLKTDDQLVFNPNSGRLTANVFVGDLAGDVTGDVTGDLTGNADTVTNGVYTTGNQSIAGVKTFTSSPLLKAGLDLVNPNLAGAMGITLQNEDGKFLLYTDEGQLVIKDFLVDTGASTDGTDTFPFKLQSGAATDTFIIKTGGRVDVSGALHAGSFVGDVTGNVSGSSGSTTGNAATATKLATARAINGVNFDGSAAITVPAAGSTLTDTVTVAKGGTGATTLTSNAVLTGNGTSAIQAESTFTYDGAGIAVITGVLPQLQLVDSDATNSPMGRIMNNSGNLSIRADSSNVGTGGAINFQTSGSEKMRIQDNGNVGIGTTSPQANLHISGGTGGDGVLIIEADTDNNAEADQPYIVFEQDGGTQHSAIGSHSGGDTDNNALIFSNSVGSSGVEAGMIFKTGETSGYANATERMRITPAGNIGIGTTSPASLLHVGSTAYELSSGAYLTSSHQRTAKMVIHADDANTDWDEQEIGLALHNEDPTNNNWSPHIAFTTHEDDDGDPTNANPVAVAAISATYNTRVANGWAKGDLVFFTNGGGSGNAERMRIDSAGNVGIGTTAPDTKLHVEGSVLIDAYNVGEDAGLFFREGFLTTDQPSITVWDMTNSGASPDGLSINANDGIRFRENGGEVARFKDGSLGIGTTSPASQLDISSASTSTLRLSNSDGGLTEDQITGEIIFYQDDDSGSADGITGRIGMRSAKRLDGTNYYGDVGDMGFFVAGSGNFTANTNAALEAMTIRAGGKVGIGTTAPEYKLDVQSGSIRILPTISSNAGTAIRIGAGGNSNDITLLRIDGESSNNSGESDSGRYGFSMKYMGSGNDTGNRYAMFMDNQAGTAIEAMSILQDGKVGIGDSTPATTLEVYDGSDANIRVRGNSNYATTLEVTSSGCKLHMGDIDSAEDSFLTFGAFSAINNLDTSGRDFHLYGTNTTTGFYFDESAGKFGIGTTTPTHKLQVNGSFTATTKEFTIPHPSKKGMTLSHGSLEGPEYGVYVRGKSKDKKVYLPDYWKDLVHEDSITVQLTSIGKSENLYVVDYNTEYIEVENDVEYFYYVQAERKDVDKLEVEF